MRGDRRFGAKNEIMIEFDGNQIPFRLWCRGHGLNYMTMYRRLYVYGWTLERALTAPVKSPGQRRTRRYDPRDNPLVKKGAYRCAYT